MFNGPLLRPPNSRRLRGLRFLVLLAGVRQGAGPRKEVRRDPCVFSLPARSQCGQASVGQHDGVGPVAIASSFSSARRAAGRVATLETGDTALWCERAALFSPRVLGGSGVRPVILAWRAASRGASVKESKKNGLTWNIFLDKISCFPLAAPERRPFPGLWRARGDVFSPGWLLLNSALPEGPQRGSWSVPDACAEARKHGV